MVCKSCGEQAATQEVQDTEVVATIRGKQVTKSDVRTTASAIGLFVAFIAWVSEDS